MEPFCPDCIEMRSRNIGLRLYQINYDEAIFMCPVKECLFPFSRFDNLQSFDQWIIKRDMSEVLLDPVCRPFSLDEGDPDQRNLRKPGGPVLACEWVADPKYMEPEFMHFSLGTKEVSTKACTNAEMHQNNLILASEHFAIPYRTSEPHRILQSQLPNVVFEGFLSPERLTASQESVDFPSPAKVTELIHTLNDVALVAACPATPPASSGMVVEVGPMEASTGDQLPTTSASAPCLEDTERHNRQRQISECRTDSPRGDLKTSQQVGPTESSSVGLEKRPLSPEMALSETDSEGMIVDIVGPQSPKRPKKAGDDEIVGLESSYSSSGNDLTRTIEVPLPELKADAVEETFEQLNAQPSIDVDPDIDDDVDMDSTVDLASSGHFDPTDERQIWDLAALLCRSLDKYRSGVFIMGSTIEFYEVLIQETARYPHLRQLLDDRFTIEYEDGGEECEMCELEIPSTRHTVTIISIIGFVASKWHPSHPYLLKTCLNRSCNMAHKENIKLKRVGDYFSYNFANGLGKSAWTKWLSITLMGIKFNLFCIVTIDEDMTTNCYFKELKSSKQWRHFQQLKNRGVQRMSSTVHCISDLNSKLIRILCWKKCSENDAVMPQSMQLRRNRTCNIGKVEDGKLESESFDVGTTATQHKRIAKKPPVKYVNEGQIPSRAVKSEPTNLLMPSAGATTNLFSKPVLKNKRNKNIAQTITKGGKVSKKEVIPEKATKTGEPPDELMHALRAVKRQLADQTRPVHVELPPAPFVGSAYQTKPRSTPGEILGTHFGQTLNVPRVPITRFRPATANVPLIKQSISPLIQRPIAGNGQSSGPVVAPIVSAAVAKETETAFEKVYVRNPNRFNKKVLDRIKKNKTSQFMGFASTAREDQPSSSAASPDLPSTSKGSVENTRSNHTSRTSSQGSGDSKAHLVASNVFGRPEAVAATRLVLEKLKTISTAHGRTTSQSLTKQRPMPLVATQGQPPNTSQYAATDNMYIQSTTSNVDVPMTSYDQAVNEFVDPIYMTADGDDVINTLPFGHNDYDDY